MKRLVIGFIAILAVGACVSPVPVPTEAQLSVAQQRWPSASLADLQEGRQLYVRRCSSCHNLHLPTEYTAEEWPAIIAEMGQEYARIDKDQQGLVLRYVISALETPPPAE